MQETQEINYKQFNNFKGNYSPRFIERNHERVKKMKLSKEGSKKVAARLQMKIIQRGGTSNLGANFFAHS